MELKEYFDVIKKRLSLIIVITLLATITSGVLSFFVIKPVYKADISVIIGKTESDASAKKVDYNDVMMYQKLVKTYSMLAVTKTVAEDVIKNLKLNISVDQLISMISVAPKGDTEFLTITVKSKNAEEAMNIANQVAKSLKEVSKDVKKVDNVQLLDKAELPVKPDNPKPLLNVAIAFFIGLMASVGIVFMIEYLDNTVKSQDDIEKLIDVPVIGIIPFVSDKE